MYLVSAVILAALIYAVQAYVYNRKWDESLKIGMQYRDDYINVGDSSQVIEVVDNAKKLPLPILHVKFVVSSDFDFKDMENASITDAFYRNDAFSVMGNQKITRKLSFVAKKRGYYSIDSAQIVSRNLFLTKSYAKKVKTDAHIYVLPKKMDSVDAEQFMNNLMGDILCRKSFMEDPYSLNGIRKYEPYDNIKKINWKQTAKFDELMVNTYNSVSDIRATILLNVDTNNMVREDEIREISISIASSIAAELIEKSILVRLVSNGRDLITKERDHVEYGSSKGHILAIDKLLSRIANEHGVESFLDVVDAEQHKENNNDIVIVVSAYYKQDLLLKLDNIKANGTPVYMVVPHFDVHTMKESRDYIYDVEVKYIDA